MPHEWEAVRSAVVRGFSHLRVLVVGDLMLDRYIWGSVSRISPEAPVPVVKFQRESEMLGGAANVAANLLNLGVQTSLFGFVGDDASGAKLIALATEMGFDPLGLVRGDGLLRTTTKTRVLGDNHQLVRIDDESTESISNETATSLLEAIEIGLKAARFDAIILSDYAKGLATPEVCQKLMELAKKHGVPVHVDPKGTDFEKYRGATSIKPNRSEMALVSGIRAEATEALIAVAVQMRSELSTEFLTLTLGGDGAALIDANGVQRVPTQAREVFDVSGAGDATLAAMVAGLAAGLEPIEAVRLASLAAAQVVAHVGSTPILKHELLLALYADRLDQKVVDQDEADKVAEAWRNRGHRVSLAEATTLDADTVRRLQELASNCDRLIVTVAGDDASLIAALECVSAVVSSSP